MYVNESRKHPTFRFTLLSHLVCDSRRPFSEDRSSELGTKCVQKSALRRMPPRYFEIDHLVPAQSNIGIFFTSCIFIYYTRSAADHIFFLICITNEISLPSRSSQNRSTTHLAKTNYHDQLLFSPTLHHHALDRLVLLCTSKSNARRHR